MPQTDRTLISAFLQTFVKDQPPEGLLVLSARDHTSERREYRRFPASDWQSAAEWAAIMSEGGRSVFYKTCLFKPDATRLIKENALPEAVWVWADLDEMDPSSLPVQPTFLIESSPRRYQALWRVAPESIRTVERYARTLAQYGDHSGWDIGQELRVPGTCNYKYADAPQVRIVGEGPTYTLRNMGIAPAAEGGVFVEPDTDIEALLATPMANGPAYTQEEYIGAAEGRSGALWSVLNRLRDDGFTANDAMTMMWWSPLNKYRIQGRPPRDLWRDIIKCWSQQMRPPTAHVEFQPAPSVATQLRAIRYPLLVEQAISTFKPATLFSEDSLALMFLSAYSAGFPQVRMDGHNLGLWTLILGGQASGKSTLIGGLSQALLAAVPTLGLVTSGSPEGIMEQVAEGPTMLAYDEYSEQLKQMAKRDGYATTNKELYQRMFDGAPLGHATRRAAIQSKSTFVVMMAGTNADTWRKYGDPEDIVNGYLSRFIIIAGDLVERSLNRSNMGDNMERLASLIRERIMYGGVVHKVNLSNMYPYAYEGVARIVPVVRGFEVSYGDLLMMEFQQELERGWDLKFNLDEASVQQAFSIPPGRTLTKTRKMCALLELAEERPQIHNGELYVRESNIIAAIELSRRSATWSQRAIDWLQSSQEKEHVDKILSVLAKAQERDTNGEGWVRPWDIAVRIRGVNATQVKTLLNMMADSGMVEKKMQARSNGVPSELWRIAGVRQ